MSLTTSNFKSMRKIIIALFSLIVIPACSQVQPEFLTDYNKEWVDSVFKSLTVEEKIGQVLMPRANFSYQGYDPAYLREIVQKYKLGGLVFFAGQPTIQATLTNELQGMSRIPMLIGTDMEWGPAMRLDSTGRFPYNMSLGAMQGGEDLLFKMGVEIAKQAQRIGVHVNYAPVVDVNNNPKNPVINFRSFGEDKINVANKALAVMQGMQSQKLLTSAKHFPGHGDTGVDSHYDLPVIPHSKEHLKNLELFPFQHLINNGITGIMGSHLNIPSLEPKIGLASTFSKNVFQKLLKDEMGFKGLVFTDGMDMEGAVKNFEPGEQMVEALLAGNDVIETFADVPTAYNAIKRAVESGRIPMKLLDEKVLKILKAKSWVGLDNYKPVAIEGLIEDVNSLEADWLNRELAERTLVALRDKNLPLEDISKPTWVISIGEKEVTDFQEMAENYTNINRISMVENEMSVDIIDLFKKGGNVIIGLHLGNNRPGVNYGFKDYMDGMLSTLSSIENAILVVFGNPYVLDKITDIDKFDNIILANQNTRYMENAAAMAVFGGIDINGRLPVTVNDNFKANDGVWVQNTGRLSYGIPEMVGLSSEVLNNRLDDIVKEGLEAKAYPGAALEVVKDGRVIYQKAFGHHTYEDAENDDFVTAAPEVRYELVNKGEAMDSRSFENTGGASAVIREDKKGRVHLNDLYDLASVTKISTGALAIMQLMSEGKFDINKTFADYYPDFKNTNKADLVFKDMLTHRAGLRAWIPFWMNAVDSLGTLKKALELNPEMEPYFIKEKERQSFWDRLFKREPTYAINYDKSLAEDPSLWEKALSKETLTWIPGIFSDKKTRRFSVEVADSLYMNQRRMKFIHKQIEVSPLKPDQGYVYSDLHYYTYPKMIGKMVGKDWEEYLKETYTAIGANSLTYNPRRFYDLNQIVPTEVDTLFRKTLIHGRVHDEGAGMLEGISAHAGLFGNVNDVAKLMQMYLQEGYYGGKQFIKPEVVREATSYQFPYEGNRRGIAFDKLDFNKKLTNGPQSASEKSYGHSGFTGTFTWIDSEYDMLYVFLSNRVYPTRDNNKISTLDIRTRIGDEIIKTIKGE